MLRITSGDRERTFFLVLPPDWFLHVPLPVVVCFHPGGSTGREAADLYRFHEVARDPAGPRFVTLYH